MHRSTDNTLDRQHAGVRDAFQQLFDGLRSTAQAADELGIGYGILYRLVRDRKINQPMRDAANRFVWRPADIQAAKAALAERGA